MQRLDYKVTTFSPSEQFFTERLIELLHRLTIDTFRSRAMNPKTILVELRTLLADNRISNPKQYEYAILEARNLLLDRYENELCFGSISKNYFINLISKLKKNGDNKKDRAEVLLAIDSLIIEQNKDYDRRLLDTIESHLGKYNAGATTEDKFIYFEKLQILISFFITELISAGYSKRFLFRFVSNRFAGRETTTFTAGINAFKELLLKKLREFEVVFKLEIPPGIASNITLIGNIKSRLHNDIGDIINAVPEGVSVKVKTKLENFAKKTFRSPHYLRSGVKALDPFTALEMARISLSDNLDLIHLGYSKEEVFAEKTALIMEKNAQGIRYQFRELKYELDGNFRDGIDLYKQFSGSLSKIVQDNSIKIESKEKLKSAIRYLRLGNSAIEAEHKFLNYWIAMEYLFSDIEERSGINEIKKYFSRLHANIYLNRLLNDFHCNIIRLGKGSVVPGYDRDNLTYLKNVAAYDYIINNLATDSPLLAHRAEKIKRILFPLPQAPSNIQSDLEKLIHRHTANLELHLSRMYRIRNTIIHNAAINMDIISTAENLKYYLTFILCYSIAELIENTAVKCIEDFLVSHEIIYNSLCEEKFPKEKLFAIKTHFDIIA